MIRYRPRRHTLNRTPGVSITRRWLIHWNGTIHMLNIRMTPSTTGFMVNLSIIFTTTRTEIRMKEHLYVLDDPSNLEVVLIWK